MCPMYSYVLYYNIDKSGFNAVSAHLLSLIDWLNGKGFTLYSSKSNIIIITADVLLVRKS